MRLFAFLLIFATTLHAAPPNIVVIMGDDVGYGDLATYGATAVKTPNCDRVAREGIKFTNGYATSATCTPSRFSFLTGEYAWRQKGTGILPGDASLIIQPGRTTLPSALAHAGYRCGVVGKWHLGLGGNGKPADWNGEVKPGPLEIGFHSSFIMAATGDRVPCVFVKDHRVVGLDPADPIEVRYYKPFDGEPTGITDRATLKLNWSHEHNQAVVNGIGRLGFMRGGKAALWKDEEMADTFAREAVGFIEREKAHPFFLYFATHSIHVPRVPHPRFADATTMGARGAAIAEFDWQVGEVLATLDRLKLTENTLVIITSDNGPVLDDGYKDRAVELLGSHKPAGDLRGGKYSEFEGGTRVPFIVRWPARVKPGVSDAPISQIDLAATFAKLAGDSTSAFIDSRDASAALFGEDRTGRAQIVEQGNHLCLREGDWLYVTPGPSRDGLGPWQDVKMPAGALFDLKNDASQRKNLIEDQADRAAKMAADLKAIQAESPAH